MPVMDSSRELHPRENILKKEWIDQSLQSTSPEQVQHSHNHTLSLLRPETAQTFLSPVVYMTNWYLFPMLIFFFNEKDLLRPMQKKQKE